MRLPVHGVLRMPWECSRRWQVVTALTVCVLHDMDVLERPVAHMRNDIREAFEIPKTIDVPDDDDDEYIAR